MNTIKCEGCDGTGLILEGSKRCFTCEGYGKLVIMMIPEHVLLVEKGHAVRKYQDAEKKLDVISVGMRKIIEDIDR